MAQRTPIRSILSVVPSKQTSKEREQPSERGASRARNASERQPPRQRRQRKQNTQQPQQRQQFNKKIAQEPILPLQPRQRLSTETPISRMVNGLPLPRQTMVETYKTSLEWQRYREHRRNPQSERSNTVNNLNIVPSSVRQQRIRKAKQQKKGISPLIYGARILILGVGIGVIAGTLLSIFDPASRLPKETSQLENTELQTGKSFAQPALQMTSEIEPLKKQLQELAAQHSDLTASALFVDVDTGAYTELNSNLSLAAASTIKVPILIAFFQDVEAGKIRLDEMLKMEAEDIAKGSGEMQYQPPGKLYSAIEVATLMITNSDNTATNMLIKRLGGATILNQRFKSWGLNKTAIRNLLPDLEGTNTTSVRDMGHLLTLIHQGKLVSLRNRDRIFEIMRRTVNKSLLPQGIDKSATIAHKTGDIGTSIADVGIIDLPNGKRYLAAAIVKRPHNDARAEELIRQFSQKAYQFFSQSNN